MHVYGVYRRRARVAHSMLRRSMIRMPIQARNRLAVYPHANRYVARQGHSGAFPLESCRPSWSTGIAPVSNNELPHALLHARGKYPYLGAPPRARRRAGYAGVHGHVVHGCGHVGERQRVYRRRRAEDGGFACSDYTWKDQGDLSYVRTV
ncbi:hypothetical protein BKA93DRAFT_582777 [Sparassis latifolia]